MLLSLFPDQLKLITLQDAVVQIKQMIEQAIRYGDKDKFGKPINGCEAKNNIIRTQIPINLLHDAVKTAFIQEGVNPNLILPPLGQHQGELRIYGYIKAKDQDVCFMPNNVRPNPEILTFDGILKGERDPLGFDYTERVLSVNVRSQLSSVAKNFDTLYERTFAEPLNLHLRCPKMVLGEVYMIPVYEYDDAAAQQNRIDFKPNPRVQKHIAKYINSFNAVNLRPSIDGNEMRYERACLIIVDFSRDVPYIYNTNEELINDGLLPFDTDSNIETLSFPTFASTLLTIYSQRFGEGRFI